MEYDDTPFKIIDSLVWIINNKAVAADKLKAAAILMDVDPGELLTVVPILAAMGDLRATVIVGHPSVIPDPEPPKAEPVSMAPPFHPVNHVRAKRDETKVKRNGGAGKERVRYAHSVLGKLTDDALGAYYHTLGEKPGDVLTHGPNKGALRPNVVKAIENIEAELKRRKRKDLLTRPTMAH